MNNSEFKASLNNLVKPYLKNKTNKRAGIQFKEKKTGSLGKKADITWWRLKKGELISEVNNLPPFWMLGKWSNFAIYC